MEYFSWKFVCFVIIFIRSDFINGIYFKTCNEYKDKMSSSKFIKSEVNHSVYTCGLRCSITNLCDGYTFNTDNRTCSLYRIRELEFINETTTDTQLYLTQSGKVITHVLYVLKYYIDGVSAYLLAISWWEQAAFRWDNVRVVIDHHD